MRNNWVILLLVMLLAASAGCTSKKQTVRGGAGEAGGGTSGGQGGLSGPGGAGSDGITSETLRPDAGVKPVRGGAGGSGVGGGGLGEPGSDGRLALAEAQAGVGATQEKASPFQDIYFDFDQSTIRDDARPVLAGIAAYMTKNSVKQLIIEGHCDSRGTAEYNMALGERRAESAKKYLQALGVKSAALTTVSYGKEKPFMQGESEEAWSRNRRGHFLVR